MFRTVALILCFAFIPLSAVASEPLPLENDTAWWQRFGNRVAETWNSPTWDLYVPFLSWHNRLMYDRSKTDNYNEMPWGAGLGKSMYDEDGDWHALVAMGFQDSHDMFQPLACYGFQKNWRPWDSEDWRLGVGFMAGVTARHDFWGYTPLPLALPMAGVEYKNVAVQAVYIPGTYNNGNVLFCWLRWQFN